MKRSRKIFAVLLCLGLLFSTALSGCRALIEGSAQSSDSISSSSTQPSSQDSSSSQQISSSVSSAKASSSAPAASKSSQAASQVSNETVSQQNAVKSAKSYIKYSSFSREGLINQLIYEKFTKEQAEYGVSANGL